MPATETFNADRFRLMFALADEGQGLDVAGAANRIAELLKPAVSPNSAAACELALWRMKQGLPPGDTTGRFRASCARTLTITRIDLKDTAAATRALEVADSTLRNTLESGEVLRGYETFYLARAWEAVGRPDRALTAIRYRRPGSFQAEAPWLLDDEARLALAVGDTASAVRALEFYLPIIADAEPPIAARRDSLRALLTGLKAKR